MNQEEQENMPRYDWWVIALASIIGLAILQVGLLISGWLFLTR